MLEIEIDIKCKKINKKLKKYGLRMDNIEFLGNYVNWCNIDLIDIEKYYTLFMKVYSDLDFSDIRDHQDYHNYDYDDQTFIKEELEQTFNDILVYNRDQDICTLNNDLIGEINIKCCNFLNKDYYKGVNPIGVIIKS